MGQTVKAGQYWQFPAGQLVFIEAINETHWYGTLTIGDHTTTVRGPAAKIQEFVEVATLLASEGAEPVQNNAAEENASNVHQIKHN